MAFILPQSYGRPYGYPIKLDESPDWVDERGYLVDQGWIEKGGKSSDMEGGKGVFDRRCVWFRVGKARGRGFEEIGFPKVPERVPRMMGKVFVREEKVPEGRSDNKKGIFTKIPFLWWRREGDSNPRYRYSSTSV